MLTLTFDSIASYLLRTGVDVAALARALVAVSELDAHLRRIVEKRLFVRFTINRISEVPGILPATIKRDWVTAGAWLFVAMTGEARA